MDVQTFIVKRRELQERLEQNRTTISHTLTTARQIPSLPGVLTSSLVTSGLLKGIMTAAGGWVMSKLVPRRFLPYTQRGIFPQLLRLL